MKLSTKRSLFKIIDQNLFFLALVCLCLAVVLDIVLRVFYTPHMAFAWLAITPLLFQVVLVSYPKAAEFMLPHTNNTSRLLVCIEVSILLFFSAAFLFDLISGEQLLTTAQLDTAGIYGIASLYHLYYRLYIRVKQAEGDGFLLTIPDDVPRFDLRLFWRRSKIRPVYIQIRIRELIRTELNH